jgi:hypothetical protein
MTSSDIHFYASSTLPLFNGEWEIGSSKEPMSMTQRQHLHRVLELAVEAEIFHHEVEPKEKHVRIVVMSEGRKFESFLSESDISHNVATQALLQLLVIYDGEFKNSKFKNNELVEKDKTNENT